MFKKWGPYVIVGHNNIKWSSIISLRYHNFSAKSHSYWCTCLTLAQFLQLSQTATQQPLLTSWRVNSDSQCTCPYLLSPVLIATATMLLIVCADNLTFTALWVQVCMCVSVTLGSRWYTVCLSNSYSRNMSCHSAAPVSHSPFTVNLHTTFAISCFWKMLQVNLRRRGGSNVAAFSRFWNMKKGIFMCCWPCILVIFYFVFPT